MVDNCDMGPVTSGAAVTISDCALVNLCRTHAVGEEESYGTALKIADSTVVLSQCGFIGSSGYDSYYYGNGGMGYPGVEAINSTLYFLASSAYGGPGGDAYQDDYKIFHGGDGAPGIFLSGCTLHLFGLQKHTISGGYGGHPSNWYAYYGDDANAVEAMYSQILYSGVTLLTQSVIYVPPPVFGGSGSQVDNIAPAVPVMTMDEPATIGTDIIPTLHGSSGWNYWVVASNGFTDLALPFINTHLFVDPSLLMMVASGTLDSSNKEEFRIPIPVLPVFQGVAVHMQAYVDTGTGKYYLSTPVDFLVR